MAQKLFLLPGDGIGTEIMAEVEKLVAWLNSQGETDFTLDTGLVGGCAYDKHGVAISEEDMAKALAADAVIFGAVGGPKWDKVPYEHPPGSRPAAPAQGSAACSPTCAPPSATRRWPMPPR